MDTGLVTGWGGAAVSKVVCGLITGTAGTETGGSVDKEEEDGSTVDSVELSSEHITSGHKLKTKISSVIRFILATKENEITHFVPCTDQRSLPTDLHPALSSKNMVPDGH